MPASTSGWRDTASAPAMATSALTMATGGEEIDTMVAAPRPAPNARAMNAVFGWCSVQSRVRP